jgi:hypothetical protein
MKNKKMNLMKMVATLLLTWTMILTSQATASVTGPTGQPTSKSTTQSTHETTGKVDLSKVIPEEPKLKRLEDGLSQADKEWNEVLKLINAPKSDCDKEEALLRKQDLEFLKNNHEQINEMISKVRKGLKKQKLLMRSYEKGLVEGELAEAYTNPQGEQDLSVMSEVSTQDPVTGDTVIKKIAVKDLFKYIQKFEKEALTTKDNEASVAALLKKYRDPQTQNDPAYFKMTLDQAIEVYSKKLSSVFHLSYRQEQKRELIIGSGKNIFRVLCTTVMGYSQQYKTMVGTQIGKTKQSVPSNVELNLAQNFTEALAQAEEDKYWEVLRAQQLTIDGIPVDGLLRRIYFDSQRSKECQKLSSYTFNEGSSPGPYLSYDQKAPCTKYGIELLSANITLTRHYNGSAAVGSVFDFSQQLRSQANGQMSCGSENGFRDIVSSLGIGSCDDVRLQVSYRCGCSRDVKELNQHYKIGQKVAFSCEK